jgi:hypothetical protein
MNSTRRPAIFQRTCRRSAADAYTAANSASYDDQIRMRPAEWCGPSRTGARLPHGASHGSVDRRSPEMASTPLGTAAAAFALMGLWAPGAAADCILEIAIHRPRSPH